MSAEKNIHQILRDRLHARAGIFDMSPRLNLSDLERSEWSDTFERFMRNRLIMGALRYGRMTAKRTKDYNYISDGIRRLKEYQASGNTELLVDTANLCLLAFEFDRHPNKHFAASDDGVHCK